MTTVNNPMLEKWKPEALALQEYVDPPVPTHILAGEAVDLARFVQRRWTTLRDGTGSLIAPGLDSVEKHGVIRAGIDQELMELQQALTAAESDYRLAVAPPDAAMDRARFVISELAAGLEYLFNDGVEDEDDVRLEKLATRAATSYSQDAIAQVLNDYAELASHRSEALADLGGIKVALIDEARQLTVTLKERSAGAAAPSESVEVKRELRDRVATLLFDRMRRVRSAARFVFRRHPNIAREATSAWERRGRAQRRRAAEKRAAEQPTPAVAVQPQGVTTVA